MIDRDFAALMQTEPVPGEVGKPSLALGHDVRGDLIEIGNDGPVIMGDQYARVRLKPFRLANLAILVEVDLSFLNRLDSEPSRFHKSWRGTNRFRRGLGDPDLIHPSSTWSR